MIRLAIASSNITGTTLHDLRHFNYETCALIAEGEKLFDEVIPIDVRAITYHLLQSTTLTIHHNGIPLNPPDVVIIRGTSGYESAFALLAIALDSLGCYNLDPVSRFSGRPASKLLSTVERHVRGVGTDSFIACSLATAKELADELVRRNYYPVITKPIEGRQGFGLKLHNTSDELKDYATKLFTLTRNSVILIQRYVNFSCEYRAMVLDGICMGLAQKRAQKGVLASNVRQGGSLTSADDPDIISFVESFVSPVGLLGVDVARDENGILHIIETNRAPGWSKFEEATGVNVAREVIQGLYRHVNKR